MKYQVKNGWMMFVNGLLWCLAICMSYFIETLGGYTCEKMKAYKSLEAYNYYYRFALCQH